MLKSILLRFWFFIIIHLEIEPHPLPLEGAIKPLHQTVGLRMVWWTKALSDAQLITNGIIDLGIRND